MKQLGKHKTGKACLYIKKLAKEHDIPIIENKPLARALAKQVRVGKSIPVEMYAAVANDTAPMMPPTMSP